LASTKRVRETKGIEGLFGAIKNASNTIANLKKEGSALKDNQQNGTTSLNHDSLNAQALKLWSLYFLNKVDDEQYICYVWVLEDKKRRQHSYP
jgi:hypothetical protein